MKPSPSTQVWAQLNAVAKSRLSFSLESVFLADPQRESRFTVEAPGFSLDYSRQLIDEEVIDLLLTLVRDDGFPLAVEKMFSGQPINRTEQRAAWHTLLRQHSSSGACGVVNDVLQERHRMLAFAEQIRSNGRFDTVVNIGIGGSDLGPRMAVEVIGNSAPCSIHFVSNIDGCDLYDVLSRSNPARTLFIVCSKTFSTQETMVNAEHARRWIIENLGLAAVRDHFAGVSANRALMSDFGISADNSFHLWDWVGGRFSVWSSVGLVLAIAAGRARFEEFLDGAHQMDRHFREMPSSKNIPILMALMGIWNVNFLKIPSLAILPYSSRLSSFPRFMQQLEMESNGKSVSQFGDLLDYETAPIVWGTVGNDAQHSFFQLLHQGTLRASLDFILIKRSPIGDSESQLLANANALAQIEALAVGHSSVDPHRRHPGNRPCSVLVAESLSPKTLGALIAIYEHKIFVQSLIWGINAFDQYGVERGKAIFEKTRAALSAGNTSGLLTVKHLINRVA